MSYTTVDAIQRRLQGWATTSAPNAFGVSPVDVALIEQLIGQAAARIDQCLRDRYVLPLQGTHLELTSCAEKLVMCQLIGQLYAGQAPSESGGYGALMCRQGEKELKALKDLSLAGEVSAGVRIGSPQAGQRSLPPVYRQGGAEQTMDVVRW